MDMVTARQGFPEGLYLDELVVERRNMNTFQNASQLKV